MEQINSLPNLPIQPEIPTTPPINPPSSSKHTLIILLTVSVLVFVSLNLYLFMKLQNPPLTPIASSAPVVSTSPTPSTTDETTGWKVYEYKDLGVSFKYPNTWYLLPTDGTSGSGVKIQSFDPATAPGRGYISSADKGMSRIIVDKWTDKEQVTSLEALKTFLAKDNGAQGYLYGDPVGKVVVSNEKDLSFKGFKAFYREISNSTTPNDKGAYAYFFNTKGQVIEVTLTLDNASALPVYNQILSTFKFLD